MPSVLKNPVLCLNKQWQAVNVVTVARALVMLWNESAHAVDPDSYQLFTWEDWSAMKPRDDESFVQAIKRRIRIPEVIALRNYDRLPTSAVTFSRRNVFKRDHYTCQYCGAQPGTEELTLDHVNPRSKGGQSTWENTVLACIKCNTRKADLSLEQSGLKLRKKPIKPTWKPMYARHTVRLSSWKKFLSDVYWDVKLEG